MNNLATQAGAGLHDCNGTIRNCIMWGNRAKTSAQLNQSSVPTYSCIEDWTAGGSGNISVNPCFANPQSGDFHLQCWSPCIDTGDPASPFSNEPEPNGTRVDMSAYGNTPEATSRCPDTDSDGLPDGWELHWFGNLQEQPTGDPNGDGILNEIECRYGWDPTSPAGTRVNNATNSSWYETIQVALDDARNGDEIIVYPGVYVENIGFLGKNTILRSSDPSNRTVVASTIIDGDKAGPVVTFNGNEGMGCTLSGITITNGWATNGGGITGQGTHASIENNIITRNFAWYEGGGIWDCDGVIQNNEIIANSTSQSSGGGLARCDGNIQANTIAENNGRDGGGLAYCDGIIRGNIIRANGASSEGGGLRFCDGDVIENTISGNQAWDGGGGLADCNGLVGRNSVLGNWTHATGGGLHECDGKVENNIIAENRADGFGGGIAYCGGMIQNNTVAFNSSQYGTGGVSSPNGTIVNCIVWGNKQEVSTADQLVESSTPTYSCIQNWKGGGQGNISADPLLISPAYDNYHLSKGSPCVDAGNRNVPSPPDTDIDGEPRPSGPNIDIGADEAVDTDQDALPDYWESEYFARLSFGPEDDPDKDGLTNAQELSLSTNPYNSDTDVDGHPDGDETLAGTDPLYVESLFQVRSVAFEPSGVRLTWPAVPGKTYQVYSSTDLQTWSCVGLPINSSPWDSSLSLLDSRVSGLRRYFYVVRILPSK